LDANDQLIGFIGTEEDITEYKTTIEKLKKDKDDFERINKYLVNRELRMLELKNEVEVLKKKLNEEYK
jgi:predicted  nucleic acid-binding Zn-ribbon protein